jgi:hypothetical protein
MEYQIKLNDLSEVELLIEALETAVKLTYNNKTKSDYEYLRRQIILQTSWARLYCFTVQGPGNKRPGTCNTATQNTDPDEKELSDNDRNSYPDFEAI